MSTKKCYQIRQIDVITTFFYRFSDKGIYNWSGRLVETRGVRLVLARLGRNSRMQVSEQKDVGTARCRC